MRFFKILLGLLLLPSLSFAHPGHDQAFGFFHGLAHPLSGLDHILAMVAVGLWAWQLGGRSVWLVPLSFVLVMAAGGMTGFMGVNLPWVEAGILASLLFMGLLIAVAVRVPAGVGMLIVGIFALFHGYAHGAERPENVSGLIYAAGFMLATVLLHGAGLLAGFGLQRFSQPVLVRCAGMAVTLAGVYLWIS
jgi:urease accessory protein